MTPDGPTTRREERMPDSALMTVKEVRAELRISLGKAYELIYTGELRAVRIGRLIRVTPQALPEFIAAHEGYSD